MYKKSGRNIFNIKKMAFPVFVLLLIIFFMLTLGSCTRQVSLYFAKYTGSESYLSAEKRNLSFQGDDYQKIIEELAKGPQDDKLSPTIPSTVQVNSVILSDGTAIVDLSSEILTDFEEIPHSSLTETLAIFSIVNTLTEFEEIHKVKITIEGRDSGELEGLYIEDFWGHIGIYEEFERNEEIIGKSK